jgi:Ca-activated chloride channel family protein
VDDLRYQRPGGRTAASATGELATVKFRYKPPDGEKSRLFAEPIVDSDRTFAEAPRETRFAVAVAEYGLVLRQSKFAVGASLDHALKAPRAR